MTTWEVWAAGVLDGLSAPLIFNPVDALWAWGGAESLPRDRMSWNNPLNTTQVLDRGERNMNSVGVKQYLTVADGIFATLVTLQNGHYPLIVAHLRNAVPRRAWGDACGQLGTWGTGCAWLSVDYGPLPGTLGGDMATLDRIQTVAEALAGLFFPVSGSDPKVQRQLDRIEAAAGGGVAPDLTSLKADVAAVKADVASIKADVSQLMGLLPGR